MARKYGKKVEIKIDPLAYNIGIIGESGIGKSTLIKEVCEKLAGDDGYLALDIGKECGHDAIHGIISEPVPDWDKFEEVIEDIVDNRFTDYKDLRVVIIDTLDQLFDIVEQKVIRMHNRQTPEKRVDSIKAAYGGFQGGENKAVELVLNKLWELRDVGVSVIVIGHTKRRDIEDAKTGESYSILTTNMMQKYFDAIKHQMHFFGVAYIDRNIAKEKTGKKNIVTKQDVMKGKIVSESRRISFRDDNYNIDSKSRFAVVDSDIPLDADAFIQALENAIIAESSKSGKSLDELKKEQAKEAEQKSLEIQAKIEAKSNSKSDAERSVFLIEDIKQKFGKAEFETKKAVKEIMAEFGFTSFKDEDIPIEALEQISEILAA